MMDPLSKTSAPRVKTGIAEFDAMLRGGFMKGDAVMLAGSAGTGKTTLALQYLINGIRTAGEGGIYLTFEQHPDQIYRDAENFGWDLRKMEAEDKLRIVFTSPDLLVGEGDPESLLEEPIRAVNARRIVVDSLSHLSMFGKNDDIRQETYRIVNFFKLRGMSALLIWESPQMLGQSYSISDVGLSFLVDAIVSLKFVEIDSSIRRAMVVLKMRGSDHDKSLREYEVTPTGIKVRAPFKDYQGLMSGSPTRSSSERFVDLMRKAAKEK
ncbi:MAG: AAA family ATPase [Thaumarchaeota archaeon]|nr:AAA family ATPase [Nitrososphaerota archaeon]